MNALSRRLVIWAVLVGVLSAAWSLFSSEILNYIGVEAQALYAVVSVLGRIIQGFGLPLSAGLVCTSILTSDTVADHYAQAVKRAERNVILRSESKEQ